MFEAASASQVARKESPRASWTRWPTSSPNQSPSDLDRDEDEERRARSCRGPGRRCGAAPRAPSVLDLDHRPGQAEPDEDEDAGNEEGDQADDDQGDVGEVDHDQPPVVDHAGDFAQRRRLLVRRVGERDRDRAGVEDLAEQAGRRRARARRAISGGELEPAAEVERVDVDVGSVSAWIRPSGTKTTTASSSSERRPATVGAADPRVEREPARRERLTLAAPCGPTGRRPRASSFDWRGLRGRDALAGCRARGSAALRRSAGASGGGRCRRAGSTYWTTVCSAPISMSPWQPGQR